MSTHNIGFYEDLTKIIFQLSSNMHLISSSGITLFWEKYILVEEHNTTVEDFTSVNQLTMSSADFTQFKKWLLTLNSGMSTYSKRSTGTVYK